eukprot:TRINITY_DN409_c0_g1_i10.p2 TRINITY_DN409_c0_g1~~TRINITY_DN409_c0_g1_i10.p2  ORF type:complete len:170 (-),score=32.96 TRINITY_DN409_c0_g1_i10:131-640(-)
MCIRDRQHRAQLHFFFSSRRRHTRQESVSWARRCVQETGVHISVCIFTEKQCHINFFRVSTNLHAAKWCKTLLMMVCRLRILASYLSSFISFSASVSDNTFSFNLLWKALFLNLLITDEQGLDPWLAFFGHREFLPTLRMKSSRRRERFPKEEERNASLFISSPDLINP